MRLRLAEREKGNGGEERAKSLSYLVGPTVNVPMSGDAVERYGASRQQQRDRRDRLPELDSLQP